MIISTKYILKIRGWVHPSQLWIGMIWDPGLPLTFCHVVYSYILVCSKFEIELIFQLHGCGVELYQWAKVEANVWGLVVAWCMVITQLSEYWQLKAVALVLIPGDCCMTFHIPPCTRWGKIFKPIWSLLAITTILPWGWWYVVSNSSTGSTFLIH